jgi:pyruvate formate lyase activating enzyme
MTLIIGGMLKQSLIDYPGRLSAVVFLSGCNMACPYCHNPDLATGSRVSRTGTAELLTFLKARTGFLDGVVLSGGEPTLQHGLADFCGQVHRLGYAIKLDTNGTRPGYLSRLISEKLID